MNSDSKVRLHGIGLSGFLKPGLSTTLKGIIYLAVKYDTTVVIS